MDMFNQNRNNIIEKNAPLADRMRPSTLAEFIGQDHIIGQGRLLRRAIQIDQLSSLIFYGPPGTGKTTLARIIANTTKAQFLSINAVLAGVKDIREAIKNAQEKLALYSKRTILFIDEVHRFNKAQQDALLPNVENGIVTLIGATTENPYFEVNKALISRSRIFQLKSLTEKDLKDVAYQALTDKIRGYGNKNIRISDDAIKHLIKAANGDARGVLNALELAVETTEPDENNKIELTIKTIEDSIQQRAVLYDKDGDAHYDTISAFIKSVRGSDPDAALYWMAKMLYAGEDPRFIFRRLIILASEDIGLADPNALQVVTAAAQAFDYIGMPEGRFPLTQACLYLATAPKSNTTLSFYDALNSVAEEKDDEVPNHLKDTARDKEEFGHGKGYLYPHAYRDHWVAQQYLPGVLQGKTFYEPSDQGYENSIRIKVARRKECQIEAMIESDEQDTLASSPAHSQLWQKRTSGTFGNQLGQIRDQILDLANLQSDNLVLDAYARTGLLTFEAARRMPKGTVWALAHEDKSYETLKTMAMRFPALSRPQILKSKVETVKQDIIKATGEKIAFDVVIGRNILGHASDKISLIQQLSYCLGENGHIVLAETVHSASQKISDLINFKHGLKKKFQNAENALFANVNDPMVNWNSESLKKDLNETKAFKIKISKITFSPIRRISPPDIDYWLRVSPKDTKKSLGDHLRMVISKQKFIEVEKMLHSQLDNVELPWNSTVLFITIKNVR